MAHFGKDLTSAITPQKVIFFVMSSIVNMRAIAKNMKLGWRAAILLCYLLACNVSSETDFVFQDEPPSYEVFEGMTVDLKCLQDSDQPISVIFSDVLNIVADSKLIANTSKYSFSAVHNGSRYVYTVTIRDVQRSEEGTYFCTKGFTSVKQLYLTVYYRPNERVDCVTSCRALTYFYDYKFQEYFQLNCTVKKGYPKVDLVLRLNNKKDILMIEKYEEQENEMTISFTLPLNSSLNNSHLTCNAIQNVPLQFTQYGYNDTCNFKPILLLQKLDVTITPSNVTFTEGKNITVTCGSHLCNHFVETAWVNMSSALKYSVVGNAYEKNLTVFGMDNVPNDSVKIICQVTLRNRTRSLEATIHKNQGDIAQQDTTKLPVVVVMVIILLSCCVAGLVCALIYLNRRKFSKTCKNTGERPGYITTRFVRKGNRSSE